MGVHMKYRGDNLQVTLLRKGFELSIQIPVEPVPMLVATTQFDEPMPYFIYGGILFLPLTQPYLQLWGDNWRANAPQDLVVLLDLWRQSPRELVVVLIHVFPSQDTQGYSVYADQRVHS